MRDVLDFCREWESIGLDYAVAVVAKTWGSSPRPIGSLMAVREDGLVVGSVSGGCVEANVVKAALASIQSSAQTRLHFGALDPDAVWEVGLSCGGEIDVAVSPSFQKSAGSEQRSRWLQFLDGAAPFDFGGFILSRVTAPRLFILGAAHIAIPLTAMAKSLGYRVVLIDPRKALLTSERFEVIPDEVIEGWPHEVLKTFQVDEHDFAVLLTHDPKIDLPALEYLVTTDALYIGALGSRTTHVQRKAALAEKGVSESQIARVHGPVGLDIGAKTPEEIAISILAELIKTRRQHE